MSKVAEGSGALMISYMINPMGSTAACSGMSAPTMTKTCHECGESREPHVLLQFTHAKKESFVPVCSDRSSCMQPYATSPNWEKWKYANQDRAPSDWGSQWK